MKIFTFSLVFLLSLLLMFSYGCGTKPIDDSDNVNNNSANDQGSINNAGTTANDVTSGITQTTNDADIINSEIANNDLDNTTADLEQIDW